ncbi:MAG: putative lipid II flippase FtsW [Candidatus Latescibacteria bacterium]|nr:putative lipid II flippase FtsW [Candidatus Latescibacterota bacterium]
MSPNLRHMNDTHHRVDRTILTVVLLLVALGIVMVYSASSTVATARFGDGAYYLKRHLIRVGLGLLLMVLLAKARYNRVVRLGRPLLGISLAALVLVLVPGLGGVAARGAHRWLALGPFSFQPSELARFALLLWLADTLVARRNILGRFTDGLLPVIAPVAAAVVLILVEPDYSTAIAVAAVCGGMIFLAGARLVHLGGLVAGVIPLVYFALISSEYRLARVIAFLEGTNDLTGSNYQVWQSLIGLGSGGLFGKGLGNGAQKLRFLPEPFNDFIFSIVGEELGLIGALLLLLLLLILVFQGFRVAGSVRSHTGALLAAGVSLSIGLYALVNVGVVTSLLPATGLALPFISYGGSSMIFSLAGVGLLLGISRDVELEPIKLGWRRKR